MWVRICIGVKGHKSVSKSPHESQKACASQESTWESKGVHELGIKGPRSGGENREV